MTVATETVRNGPYYPNGVTTVFPFTFRAVSKQEVRFVRIEADGRPTVISSALYSVVVTGAGGSVVFANPLLTSALPHYIESDPLFLQPVSIENQGAFLPSVLTDVFDRLASGMLWLRDRLARSFVIPITGGVDGKFPVVLPGGVAGFSAGTGADIGLRQDFANPVLGGSLGRYLNGLTFQQGYDLIQSASVDTARRSPPYSGNIDCFDCWPAPVGGFWVAAKRISGMYYVVRVLRTTGIIEELVIQDSSASVGPYYTDQIVSHRSYWGGFVQNWLLQPAAPGVQTATRWAFRMGLSSDSFAVIEANACEIGIQARTDTPAAPTVKMDGGANLQSLAAWPIGTLLFGNQWTSDHTYRLKSPTGVWAVSMASGLVIDKDFGLREITTMSALVANVRVQNSPASMHATHKGSFATHCKLRGPATIGPFNNPTTVPLVDDGQQKGNWRKYDVNTDPVTGIPGGSAAQDSIAFYNPNFPLQYRMRSGKGPAWQNQAENKTPWADCGYGVAHVTDQGSAAGFAKAVFYACTTTDGGSEQYALTVGNPHVIYTFRSVELGTAI